MRVSKKFKLGKDQPELDFVDVDTLGDIPLFVDPRALRLLRTEWGQECVALVQDFFTSVLAAIRASDSEEGVRLLRGLHEPNETHLGFSKGQSKGSGLGDTLAMEVFESLSDNDAVKASGLLEHLEDTALLVEGIERDRISDITTNLIREPLISYTQHMCGYYGIPMETVDSGPLWSPAERDWSSALVELPVTSAGKLLLVPKSIVRRKLDYDAGKYYNGYVLSYLADAEIAAGSGLVHLLKDKTPRVTKKDLKAKYGQGKLVATEITKKHPEILGNYRAKKRDSIQGPLPHEEIARSRNDLPDWDEILGKVLSTPTGNEAATDYHHAIESLLSVLLSPDLSFPSKEFPIHDGRKRIDITYANTAGSGFFSWLANHFTAPSIVIECKNYTGDPTNPELDQISSRFSPSRGRVGFLLCRDFKNKELFWERCRDTAKDDRGWVIPLDDADMEELVAVRRDGPETPEFWQFFKSRFDRLTS